MQNLNINFKSCHGISKLEQSFDFSKTKSYVVYAPNGMMKTSFARTFSDFTLDKESRDQIFPTREYERLITKENNKDLDPDSVFVIEPYKQDFVSEKMSTLLVNKPLKDKYDEIHRSINEKKENLVTALSKVSGVKKELEETLAESIVFDPKEFFKALNSLNAEVIETNPSDLVNITYSQIFNEKVIKVISSDEFRLQLKEYIEKYDELLSSSAFFKKGIFNHNNASDIAKNLKSNGWFEATHTVNINKEGEKKEVLSEDDLTQIIQEEKDAILEDPDLANSFEKIDKQLKANQELRAFRQLLANNKFILPELDNLNRFKRKLWIVYLAENRSAYEELLVEFNAGKTEIEKIVQKSLEEAPKWARVVNIFNERFSVPFHVSVKDQADVILKSTRPTLEFKFKDYQNGETVPIERDELLRVLSNGERRALYILNIIFEVEARINTQQETLFVIDDIADSFDYKNKYAIVEYLNDIASQAFFYQIILTHNFDFYRTISSRLDLTREDKLHALRSSDHIRLVKEKYQKNPFDDWKKHLEKSNEKLIASIPFIRNLADYCGYDDHSYTLTQMLHVKEDSSDISVSNLEDIIKAIIKDKEDLSLSNGEVKIQKLIYDTSDKIVQETHEGMDLEKKIVLSIAIRLRAEEFMIKEIANDDFVKSIKRHQTHALIKEYERIKPEQSGNIKLVKKVNLMTPENIHVNAFMYEPIIDMSDGHLKKLYESASNLS